MVYNEKYNMWCDATGKIYKQDINGEFIECNQYNIGKGYLCVSVTKPKHTVIRSHRLIWETFNGEIPEGYEIDHINTVRDDNRLDNLRCVTSKENSNNKLTLHHREKLKIGVKDKVYSEFGKKYIEHFGYSISKNPKQYSKEKTWYRRHNNTCRWEVK